MHKKLIVKHGRRAIVLGLLFLMTSVPVFAGQPIIWEISSRADLLKGDSGGAGKEGMGAFL